MGTGAASMTFFAFQEPDSPTWTVNNGSDPIVSFDGGVGDVNEADAKWLADVLEKRQTMDSSFGDRIRQ